MARGSRRSRAGAVVVLRRRPVAPGGDALLRQRFGKGGGSRGATGSPAAFDVARC